MEVKPYVSVRAEGLCQPHRRTAGEIKACRRYPEKEGRHASNRQKIWDTYVERKEKGGMEEVGAHKLTDSRMGRPSEEKNAGPTI